MAIINTEKELINLYEELDKKKLVLPNFQRGFVWDRNKQKQLLSSILVDLPVGSLLILEGDSADFTKRQLCYPDELEQSGECFYVLDGQQRLSTLRTILYDVFSDSDKDWKYVWDHLYGPLRTRWFLRVKPSDGEQDYFGFSNLQFNDLKNLTDTDVIDFLEFKAVHKTKNKEAHHPDFRPVKDDGTKETKKAFITNAITSAYSDEYLIPLYEVYKGNDGIHIKVIRKIAENRIDDLKLLAEDSDFAREYYVDLFSNISSSDEIDDLHAEASKNDTFDDSIFTYKWAELKSDWVKDFSSELNSLVNRKMAIIHLHRNEMSRAVAIFEAINRGGEPLSVYDLVVAKSARDQSVENLSSKIIKILSKNIEVSDKLSEKYHRELEVKGVALWAPTSMGVIAGNEPSKQFKDCFVNTLSLLVNVKGNNDDCRVDHIKKDKILTLSSTEINEYTDRAIISVVRALAFMQLRCGITSAKNIPYKLMLVVLAFHLEDDSVWESKRDLDKLEYWYWVSLLGGSYFTGQNQRCAEDITELKLLLNTGENLFSTTEKKVLNRPEYVTKDILLRKADEQEPSSVKNAILSFILSRCPKDFLKSELGKFVELSPWKIANQAVIVELHHVIPLGSETKLGESSSELRRDSSHPLNSCLNLAYISKEANRTIRDKTPQEYIKHIDELGAIGNYIPAIKHFQDAMTTSKYENVLEERFNLIQWAIKQHIDSLL